MMFKNRQEAGRQLAKALGIYVGKSAVVYALPRGGVPLAKVVADDLDAELSLIIVRKVGHPWSPEYAIGAVTEKGRPLLNTREAAKLYKKLLKELIDEQRQEAGRRRKVYLGGKEPISAKGKIAIVVDDGVATGMTFKKAIVEARLMRPKKLVAAVPVMPRESVGEFEKLVDELVVLEAPRDFLGSVGAYYDNFDQVEDEDIVRLLSM